MSLRIINAAEVRMLLPMARCIDVMADAMKATSDRTVSIPNRLVMPLSDDKGFLFLMPGAASTPAICGAKIISQHPDNPARGQPAIQGFVALFDHDTGAPTAIIDGAEITAIRTAAASALATRHLARGDVRTHGIIGTGVQAVTHIEAIAAVAEIDEVLIWGRTADKAQKLAAELNIRACSDPEEAAGCDVVSAVTGSHEPVIHGDWVKPGAHVNLVGAHTPATREADSKLMAKGSVFVDLMESALNESGDILIPLEEGRFGRSHIRGEIGQLVSGAIEGRRAPEDVTIYVSLGITAQDLYAAHAIDVAAREAGIGTQVNLSRYEVNETPSGTG
jgi:ornithine cyclodeaminase/alanine dehydrogenase-like protein (mu-crystallin family)